MSEKDRLTQREKFLHLLNQIMKEIETIDEDTEWTSVESKWWLDMMVLWRKAKEMKSKHKP